VEAKRAIFAPFSNSLHHQQTSASGVNMRQLDMNDQLLNPRYKKTNGKDWATVGRLDVDSTGLLIFSRDGPLCKSIIDETSSVKKEYQVKLKPVFDTPDFDRIKEQSNEGKLFLRGDKRPIKPIEQIDWVKKNEIMRVVLTEGRKRQVRRMVEEILKRKCMALKRLNVGPISLGTLNVGQWRYIKSSEIDALKGVA